MVPLSTGIMRKAGQHVSVLVAQPLHPHHQHYVLNGQGLCCLAIPIVLLEKTKNLAT
jgi:hypothetical protein